MSKDIRDEFVAVKLTGKEKRKVVRDAKRQGRDISSYVRRKLLHEGKGGSKG